MISKTRRRCTAVVAALLCATTAAAQENRGTPRAEGRRLCASYIPDPTRVEQCLRQSKLDLSDACRLVFEQSTSPVASRANNRIGLPPLGARPKSYANAAETPCVPATRS
jgi:hypothetical protein